MDIELVDTHCHIQSAGNPEGERASHDLWEQAPGLTGDQIISSATAAGVTRLVCVGCDYADSNLAITFASSRANCWATIGIHPHEAKDYVSDATAQASFAALAELPKVVAVGECGLDYFYGHSSKEDQIALLRFQFELAQTYDLPMIFHVREALDDFWPVFDSYTTNERPIRGVLHSFTDSIENLEKALERGLFMGVNGISTFAKNPAQIDMYKAIPLENLVFETDAPFLTPVPYRGTINESKYIRIIAEFIATLRGENLEMVAKSSTTNARTLFGLT
jgi:TatD DNase family protein